MNAQPALLVPRILHGAMLASVFTFGGVLWFLIGGSSEPGGDVTLFLPVFGLLAAAQLFVLAPTMKRNMLKRRAGSGPETESSALAKYQSALIVAWAMSESVALFGFVLSFLSRDLNYFGAFAFAALASLYYHRPSEEELRALVQG